MHAIGYLEGEAGALQGLGASFVHASRCADKNQSLQVSVHGDDLTDVARSSTFAPMVIFGHLVCTFSARQILMAGMHSHVLKLTICSNTYQPAADT